jgi:hypothetical protein
MIRLYGKAPGNFNKIENRPANSGEHRLATCATQKPNSPHFYGGGQKMIDHIRSAIWIAFHGLGSTE